jgi:GDP-L-fucose synthase
MKKIFIAGHNGMVGSHIYSLLKKRKKNKIIIASKKQLNLLDQKKVFEFLKKKKPKEVYICAALVGGINANNTLPAQFIYENLTISSNLIHGCFKTNIKKILYLGSSCVYPKNSKIPIKEDALLSGSLESTNEAYAVAKIAGIEMCRFYNIQYKDKKIDYRSVMPCNLYGPRDNFDPNLGHVIPSLIFKFHQAKIKKLKQVKLWGNGRPKREFLYVEDLAKACVFLMNLKKEIFYKYNNKYQHYNIGTSKEISINKLAHLIAKVIVFKGRIIFDKTNPNGTMRKVMDTSKIKMTNWKANTSLENGIKKTYEYFLKNYGSN